MTIDLSKEIIWIFTEPRSGSTWFSRKLSLILNRRLHPRDQGFESKNNKEIGDFFLSRQQLETDKEVIFDTHFFSGLKGLKNYSNPIVLRVTRKNKVEQFLSRVIATKYNHNRVWNVITEQERNNLPIIEKTVVSINEVREYIRLTKRNESLWNEYSSIYRNETIYYEDLLENFNSKILPVSNLSMKIEEEGLPLKMPYNKKDIFINYDQIAKLIKREMPETHQE